MFLGNVLFATKISAHAFMYEDVWSVNTYTMTLNLSLVRTCAIHAAVFYSCFKVVRCWLASMPPAMSNQRPSNRRSIRLQSARQRSVRSNGILELLVFLFDPCIRPIILPLPWCALKIINVIDWTRCGK